jgi:hypothetical protein
MADASLQIGNGNWAVKTSLLLGYNVVSNRYNPIEIGVTRETTGSRTNVAGIIDYKDNNIARINYASGVGSLLLEPQRTNLITYSEQFDNILGWNKANVTVTADSIISPSGVQNADTIIANGTAGVLHGIQNPISTALTAVPYSFSCYAKKGTNNFIQFLMPGASGGMYANFDLNNGVVGSLGATTGATPTSSIQNMGNGWYKCNMTFTVLLGGTYAVSIYLVSSATSARAEVNALATDVYLWGAQLEQGAYPTSYIPTTTTALTRNQDASSKSGISDLIGQTEGVMFIESAALFNDLTLRATSISDGTFSNRLYIYYNNQSNSILISGSSNGVIFSNTITFTLTDETKFAKIAVRYKANDISLWINGIKRGTDITSQTLPLNLSRFAFDSGTGTVAFLYAKVKQVQLYKTYLTDTEMANLTTL